MPPQQGDPLLDFVDERLGLCAHVSLVRERRLGSAGNREGAQHRDTAPGCKPWGKLGPIHIRTIPTLRHTGLRAGMTGVLV